VYIVITVCPTDDTIFALKQAAVSTINAAGSLQLTTDDVLVVPPPECTGGVLQYLKRDLSQAQIVIKTSTTVSADAALASAQLIVQAVTDSTFGTDLGNGVAQLLNTVVVQGENSGAKAVSLTDASVAGTGSGGSAQIAVSICLLIVLLMATLLQ
jgi:hypothetical protein